MKNYKLKKNQNGVALALGIILLLIISLIGISSMKSALLQEKMASGLKNRELSDAAALSLLVEAERWLFKYYEIGNGVDLGIGSTYMVEARSPTAYAFRSDRDLLGGFDTLIDINAKFGGVLALNPKFIIEPQKDTSSGGGGTTYGTTEGEADGGSAGSGNGSPGDSGTKGKLLIYRIVTKATDTTGEVFTGFESVISVKSR